MWRSSAFPWTYVEAHFAGRRAEHLFQNVQAYVMFIGQPRSGTSLLGSILNAHRNMCVAQELNALKYVSRGYDRRQLFWLLLKRDGSFAHTGRRWTGYDYVVPNQWQGHVEELQVVGDKKAGLSTDQIGRDPKLLDRLAQIVQVPIRLVHVVRDPMNVIATVHRRRKISLHRSTEIYFRRCETNWQVMREYGDDVQTLRLEDLIATPHEYLINLCQFLGVTPSTDYITDCAGILFSRPRQSKAAVEWPKTLVERIQEEAQRYPFLSSYSIDAATDPGSASSRSATA